MHINEAYEHQPLLPCEPAEKGCRTGACGQAVVQCVDVDAPVTLIPEVSLGPVSAHCTGTPSVTCTADAAGTSCQVVMTQKICVSIPVQYNVSAHEDAPRIDCACTDLHPSSASS